MIDKTRSDKFIPIHVTDLRYERNPIYSLGSYEQISHMPVSVSGSFKVVGHESQLATLTASMNGYAPLYLTTSRGLLSVLKEFEANLPKYLTSPDPEDRELATAIARLKGLGTQNNKEESLENDESFSEDTANPQE